MSPGPALVAIADSESVGDVAIDLLTFTHPELDEPIRISSDQTEILSLDGPVVLEGTRSRGAGRVGPDAEEPVHTFDYVAFSLVLSGYSENAAPQIRIALDLIKPAEMLKLLRVYRKERVSCLIESVLRSDPDTVVDHHSGFYLRKAPWTTASVQLVLELTRYDLEPYPVGEMTPDAFPGLFP